MSTFRLCRICLRTDFRLQKLEGKDLKFFEELCENSSDDDDTQKLCCSICEHLLRKTYYFKKKCQKSNNIFQQWKKSKNKNKPLITDLFESLPESYGKFTIPDCKGIDLTESGEFTDVTIKVEKCDDIDEVLNNGCTATGDLNKANEIVATKEIIDDYSDVSDDDKCLSDYVKGIKKTKCTKSKKRKKNGKVKIEKEKVIDEQKQKMHKQRRPLKDHDEYATVFDMELFPTEADARAEFELRSSREPYLSARYKCHVCYTVYKCQKLVDFHMRWHDPSAGDFPCDVCSMRFKSQVSMRKHKTDVHYGKFTCKRCPLITYHKMVMILHYRKHQGVSYVCKICKRSYNHSSTYMSHLRKSHPTQHVCVTCAQTFVSEKGLVVHRKKVHNTSSMWESSGSPLALARCEPCALTFANQQVYTVHLMNTHKHKDIADTLTACPECGLQLSDKLAVRAHRRELHPQYNFSAMKRAETKDQRVTCPLNITQLREHAYLHAGLKPFPCERCPAAFRSKTHLKFHMERHSPPSRECRECGKKFVSAANLSNHMRSHRGERRYKCYACGKGFLHGGALRDHVRGVHLHMRRTRKTIQL